MSRSDPDAGTLDQTGGDPGDAAQRLDLTRLARGSALNLAGSLVNAVGSFVLVVVVTRNLGAGASGAFLLATALFQVLATAGQMGADTGLGRFIPWSLNHDRPEDVRRWTLLAVAPVAGVGVVTGALAFAGADVLAGLVAEGRHRDDFVAYVRVLAPFVALTAVYFTLQTGSRAFGTMRPSVVVERLARPVVQPVLMAVVLGLGLGPVMVAAAWVGPYAAAAAALAVWYVHQLRRAERRGVGSGAGPDDGLGASSAPRPGSVPGPGSAADDVAPDARTFWRFSSPRAVAGVFQVAVRWLDVLLVGALASTREAGIYSASSRWLVGGMFVVFAINQAFQPQISALLARADRARASAIFESATAWGLALVWPLYLVLALFGPVLVRVFGAGFGEGGDALAILAVGGMLSAACGPVDMVVLMGGRSASNLVTAGAGLAVNVAVNVALVPRYGVVGAALAWSASLATTNLLATRLVRRHVRLAPFGSTWRRAVAAAAVGAGIPLLVARLALGATLAGLVTGVTAAAVLYGAVLWHWRAALQADLLTSAFRSRRARRATAASTGQTGGPRRSPTRAPSGQPVTPPAAPVVEKRDR